MPAGYGTDQGYIDYIVAQGYEEPEDTDVIAGARLRGSQYVDGTYGEWFPGQPVNGIDQDRAWPRTDAADVYGNDIASNVIPLRVIYASYEATRLEIANPGSLSKLIAENQKVKRVKAGSVEVEYAEGGAYTTIAGAIPMSTAVEGLLRPLIGTAVPLPAIAVV